MFKPSMSFMRNLIRSSTPEEEELARKRAEAKALEEALIQRELQLLTIQQEQDAFQARYLRTVGRALAELDSLVADVAEVLEKRRNVNGQPVYESPTTDTQGESSFSSCDGQEIELEDPAELKRLYREVAKRVHPDLAESTEDRAIREQQMKAVNECYLRGDLEGLRAILEEWNSRPDAVPGGGIAEELVRVIRHIARLQSRLVKVEASIAETETSDLANLQRQVAEGESEGRDVLREMEAQVLTRMVGIEDLLASIVSQHAKECNGV